MCPGKGTKLRRNIQLLNEEMKNEPFFFSGVELSPTAGRLLSCSNVFRIPVIFSSVENHHGGSMKLNHKHRGKKNSDLYEQNLPFL